MINNIKQLWAKVPKPDSFSVSCPPSINFPINKKNKQNNIVQFEELIEKSKWRKEFIDHKEVWINEDDNTFQIVCGGYSGDFQESWVEVYPDPTGHRCSVYLKINNVTIKELTFISCDGGRIFVPLPEIEGLDNGKQKFIWNSKSLEFKLTRIIGHYYIYKNIEGIARVSKIRII